jgi:hypothetical protein
MEPTNVLPILAIIALVIVEDGGWALLTFLAGRAGLADWQKGFVRAEHAHAGVLLVLSLVYLLYLPRDGLLGRARVDRRGRAARRPWSLARARGPDLQSCTRARERCSREASVTRRPEARAGRP